MASRLERDAKYRSSGRHYSAVKRYRQTAKGRAARVRERAKRLFVGARYVGYCTDATRAEAIKAHIKEQLKCFHETAVRSEN
jgi:hypothetical protein